MNPQFMKLTPRQLGDSVGGVFLLMGSTVAANLAAKSSGRNLAFPSIQLHLVTLACGSLNGQEDFKAHSYWVQLLGNRGIC